MILREDLYCPTSNEVFFIPNTPEFNCVIFEPVYIEDMSTTSWRDGS